MQGEDAAPGAGQADRTPEPAHRREIVLVRMYEITFAGQAGPAVGAET